MQSTLDHVEVSEQESYDIGLEAFVYFYPLITMDLTRRQMTNLEAGKIPGFGPTNTFSHMRAYPDCSFKAVVRPNFDTLYSSVWLDLTEEPMIISAPDTDDRYYLLPMLDMWSDVFAVPGSRTSGTKARQFLLVPPSWDGELPGTLPQGAERIEATTPYVWIIGRTKTDGPADYDAVHKVQDGFSVTPLSQWGQKATAAVVKHDSSVDMKTPPLQQVNSMTAAEYFSHASELLKLHAPHATDWSLIARLHRIGFEPGAHFSIDKLPPKVRASLEKAVAAGLKLLQSKISILGRSVTGWQMNTDTMGVYGNFYLKRAIVAMVGLGANQPEDAIYPLNLADSAGKPLHGDNKYVLHFNKDELPPVNAFWSLTMYDHDGFPCANSINRYALSSWMPMKTNSDGSLDLFIQHENPGPDKESNWLPAPKSPMNVTMRLYAPKAAALECDWNPPAIKRLN